MFDTTSCHPLHERSNEQKAYGRFHPLFSELVHSSGRLCPGLFLSIRGLPVERLAFKPTRYDILLRPSSSLLSSVSLIILLPVTFSSA